MKNKYCLFFIHGFCSGPEDWKNQFVFFKDKFRVEIPLLRGHDNKNSNNLPVSIVTTAKTIDNPIKTAKS